MHPAAKFPAFGQRAPESVRILLLEDDRCCAEVVCARLGAVAGSAPQVQWVATLADALERMAKQAFDLVVADLKLPDSSGIATLEALGRAGARLIIALTGDDAPALRDAALARGAYDFLHKEQLSDAALERLVRLAAIQANTFASLRESEARFRSLVELSSDWYWEQDEQFRFTRFAGRVAEMSGSDPQHSIGRRRWELETATPLSCTWEEHRRVLEARQPFRDFEYARVGDDGELRYISVSGEPLYDSEGRFKGYRGLGTEITPRKRVEQALRESEARFRSLAELSTDWYWEQDEQFRFTTFSGPGAEALSRRGDLSVNIGKARWEIPDLEPMDGDWSQHRAQLERHEPFRDVPMRMRMRDGTLRYMSVSGEPVLDQDGRCRGYRGVSKNVTAKVEAELQLRASEARFRSLTELSSDWYWEQDEDLRFTRLDRGLDRINIDPKSMVGRPRWEGPGVDASAPMWKAHREAVERREPFRDFEYSVMPEDGKRRTISVSGYPVFDESGRFRGYRGVGRDVTERRRGEAELRRFRSALDSAADMVFLMEVGAMRLLDFNDTACRILGYAREELVGLHPAALQIDRSPEELKKDWQRLISTTGRAETGRGTYRRKDGTTLPVEISRKVLESPDGPILVVNARDLTERMSAEKRKTAQVRHQKKIARLGEAALAKREASELVEHAVQSVFEGLGGGAVAYVERGAGERQVVLRRAAGIADLTAQTAVAFYAPDAPLARVLERSEPAVLNAPRPAGAPLPFDWARGCASAALVPVAGESGARGALCATSQTPGAFAPDELRFLAAAASMLSAALRRLDSEARLAHLAQFDTLTGLPNRALLSDRFSQMIVQARRRGSPLGALFIDLDEFKLVNDTRGHAAGDALLRETARRLQSAVRQGDTVARISGDEFAAILGDLAQPDHAALVAQKILDCLAAPLEIDGQEVFSTASIGIATFPADGEDAEALLGAADAAMYRAKQSGRNAFQFFTSEIDQRSRARAQLGLELHRALERNEFTLAYQPKFELKRRRICGAEALLRWNHSERGMVAAADFIPVLEETGLIVPVGEWVLRRACEDLKDWQACGLPAIPVAVNLSARQFRQQDLDARIRSLVESAGVDPSLIELEITESQLMHDREQAIRMLRALRAAGFRIAIDDFGTGYSSLAYLTRFPLASLKIDRSFVAEALNDEANATIVRTIIDMAHSLGFTVVAEGVESNSQAAFLRGLGCEQAQGYLFARPMPVADFKALISSAAGKSSAKARRGSR